MSIDLKDDHLPKVRTSCMTLRGLMADARAREKVTPKHAMATLAGIGKYVRVPVCDCGNCLELLKQCRKVSKDVKEKDIVPILSCKVATKFNERAIASPDYEEFDRLKDIVDASVIVHVCKDLDNCAMKHSWRPNAEYEMAKQAADHYREFVKNAPYASMKVGTKSGSEYTLYYEEDMPKVDREGSTTGLEPAQELTWFMRMGPRLVINDWFTTEVVSSQLTINTPDGPPDPKWNNVMDDIEKNLDNIERAWNELDDVAIPDEVFDYLESKGEFDRSDDSLFEEVQA